MGIKWKTTVNKMPDMTKSIKTLDGRKVEVGVIEGEHQWLAAIHEYGCNITVTQKMRAYLHYHGLHLSPNTTTIKIPERSFLRTGHDKNIDKVMKQADRAVEQVAGGYMSDQQLLDLVGQVLTTNIKTYARDLSNPPNHPYTVEQKGSSNPLVNTGGMIEGITWRTK
jgi:hypothetical protein